MSVQTNDQMTATELADKLCGTAASRIYDVNIPPSEVAETIVDLCTQSVNASVGVVEDNHARAGTPGLEDFLWLFWDSVALEVALCKPELHDRFLEILKCLKTYGRTGCEGWKVWGEEMNWEVLPLLGPNIREMYNYPMLRHDERFKDQPKPTLQDVYCILSGDAPSNPNDPWSSACQRARLRWLNLCRFIMRLWTEEVVDFEIYGIWMMRKGLEDLDLDQPDVMPNLHQDSALIYGLPETRTLNIEEASVCVQIAGAKMYKSSGIFGPNGNPGWDLPSAPGGGGNRWAGVDGYHAERWKVWKTVFQEIVSAEGTPNIRTRAVEAAKLALESMNKVEDEAAEK